MTNGSPQPEPADAPDGTADGADDRLRQLRGLLLGPELDQIATLQHRLDDPKLRSEDLSASIAWGDGATSSGVIDATGDGTFAVTGEHTYATAGLFAVAVTLDDAPLQVGCRRLSRLPKRRL